MLYRLAVEDPVQRKQMALVAVYGSLVEQTCGNWQNYPVLGLPWEILRVDEYGTPSDLTACLSDDMA